MGEKKFCVVIEYQREKLSKVFKSIFKIAQRKINSWDNHWGDHGSPYEALKHILEGFFSAKTCNKSDNIVYHS